MLTPSRTSSSTTAALPCSAASKAFTSAPSTRRLPTQARHILVKTLDECDSVMGEIAQGLPFAEAASKYSTCPSAKSGGSLGSFEPGKMVREFDEVCFDPDVPVGEVTGPVRTQFGYHLILVEDRFQNMDRTEGSGVF